jgi:hypothetical protein
MMGQRRAMVCRLDMLPPPGEAWRVEVERERSVAGEVFFKNGHMDFDWRSTASMAGRRVDWIAQQLGGWVFGDIFEGGVVVWSERRNG